MTTKKLYLGFAILLVLSVFAHVLTTSEFVMAATFCFPFQGCLGTSTVPVAGQVPIGVTGGIYTPSYLTAGSNITIATSSGGITITASVLTGAITSSSAISANHFPFWANTTGGLSGTSTITQAAGNVNVSGTVSTNGVQLSTSTGANPSASVGLTAVNGSANTFLRSDGAPALSVSIAPSWTGFHQFFTAGASTTQLWSVSSTIGTTNFTNASGTNLTVSGYLQGTNLSLTGSIGSSASRITKLWASDLDSTQATIGTVAISSAVSGDLIINNGDVNIASTTKSYKIGGTLVLSSTTLGTGVINSSLTSLGTITNLVFTNASGTNQTLTGYLQVTGSVNDANGNKYSTSTRSSSFSLNLYIPSSTTDSAFAKHQFSLPITLTRIECSDILGTSTINFDRRSSSTPNTAGANMISNLACGNAGGSTTSFTIATATVDQVVNFQVISATGIGATSTLTIRGFYNY